MYRINMRIYRTYILKYFHAIMISVVIKKGHKKLKSITSSKGRPTDGFPKNQIPSVGDVS